MSEETLLQSLQSWPSSNQHAPSNSTHPSFIAGPCDASSAFASQCDATPLLAYGQSHSIRSRDRSIAYVHVYMFIIDDRCVLGQCSAEK